MPSEKGDARPEWRRRSKRFPESVRRGRRQDPCVLYAFRCAAYAARTSRPKPELLKWWKWWNWKERAVRAT